MRSGPSWVRASATICWNWHQSVVTESAEAKGLPSADHGEHILGGALAGAVDERRAGLRVDALPVPEGFVEIRAGGWAMEGEVDEQFLHEWAEGLPSRWKARYLDRA